MASFSPCSPIMAIEDEVEISDFMKKRLKLDSILPLAAKLLKDSRYEQIRVLKILLPVVVGPNFLA